MNRTLKVIEGDLSSSEEDLSSSSFSSSLSSLTCSRGPSVDEDTPLVFMSIGTHGLFNNDKDHIPDISHICLVYKNKRFFRSSKRKVSKKCLNDLIQWLDDVKDSADGRKVILLAHNGFCCHFKVLCLNLDKYELIKESFKVIDGLVDTLDLARRFIPQKRVRDYKLTTLSEVFLECDPPKKAKTKARALQKIFKRQLADDFSKEDVYSFKCFVKSIT